jgi:hypothetical protein
MYTVQKGVARALRSDRTQEVGGSSPPSSTHKASASPGALCFRLGPDWGQLAPAYRSQIFAAGDPM